MEEEGKFGGVVRVVAEDGEVSVWVLAVDGACARRSVDAEAPGAGGDAARRADGVLRSSRWRSWELRDGCGVFRAGSWRWRGR